jgi:hypothetical protein
MDFEHSAGGCIQLSRVSFWYSTAARFLIYCVNQRRPLEQQKLLYEPLLLQPRINQ